MSSAWRTKCPSRRVLDWTAITLAKRNEDHLMPMSTFFRLLLAALPLLAMGPLHAQSLRFYGHGSAAPDLDRVKIAIDNVNDSNPGPPADIGDTDFTIEFWMRTSTGNNGSVSNCNSASYVSWTTGNIVFDRDRYDQGRAFGISLGSGRVAFGVRIGSSGYTICGTSDVRDGAWHHVVVQRTVLSGLIEIFVDGQREAFATGPTGDISYPDNGVPLATACGGGSCTNSDPFIVLGAEKHDVGPGSPAFRGWLTEMRLSTVRRYTTLPFTIPSAPFTTVDANTAALYHFDQGSGALLIDWIGNASPGVLRVGGSAPAGPEWSTESPFTVGATGVLNFTASAVPAGEASGTVTLNVRRSGGSTGAASVDVIVTGGSATSGADYQFTPVTLSWSAGETGDKAVSVTLIDDTLAESAETVVLGLSNATGATAGTTSSVTVTVTDNETGSPPAPSPSPSPTPSGGGGGAFGWLSPLLVLGFLRRCRQRLPVSG